MACCLSVTKPLPQTMLTYCHLDPRVFQWYFIWNSKVFINECIWKCGQPDGSHCSFFNVLTHWGRVTHICVGKLTIIGSDNGLLPGRRQAIIWTNAGILLIEPLGTIFSEILIGIQIFSFMKMRLKMSSAKWRPFCLGLNVLTHQGLTKHSPHMPPYLWCISEKWCQMTSQTIPDCLRFWN